MADRNVSSVPNYESLSFFFVEQGIVFGLGVPGNVIILINLWKVKKRNSVDLFIGSLSLNDVIRTFFIPLVNILVIFYSTDGDVMFATCRLASYCSSCTTIASCGFIALISHSRLLSIDGASDISQTGINSYNKQFAITQTLAMIIGVFCFVSKQRSDTGLCFLNSFTGLNRLYTSAELTVIYVMGFYVMTIYLRIAWRLFVKSRTTMPLNVPGENTIDRHNGRTTNFIMKERTDIHQKKEHIFTVIDPKLSCSNVGHIHDDECMRDSINISMNEGTVQYSKMPNIFISEDSRDSLAKKLTIPEHPRPVPSAGFRSRNRKKLERYRYQRESSRLSLHVRLSNKCFQKARAGKHTTLLLFVIALTFFLCCLPGLFLAIVSCSEDGSTPLLLFLGNFHIMGGFLNPIICFCINKNLRANTKNMFMELCSYCR